MRAEEVTIFSNPAGAVLVRRGEQTPSVLVPAATLWRLCVRADEAYAVARRKLETHQCKDLNAVRRHLWSLMGSYKATLAAHAIELPDLGESRRD